MNQNLSKQVFLTEKNKYKAIDEEIPPMLDDVSNQTVSNSRNYGEYDLVLESTKILLKF